MSAKAGSKLHEKHQIILANMLREEGNKFCADCLAKGTQREWGWLENDWAALNSRGAYIRGPAC